MLNSRRSSEILSEKKLAKNSYYETIIIGDPYCGKSTYLKRIVERELSNGQPVRIWENQNEIDFVVTNKDESKNGIFKVNDTANQERFRSLTHSYYRNAQCVLLIFDLNNSESFLNLSKWHTDALRYCKNQDDKFAIILVGLKNNTSSTRMKPSSSQIDYDLIDKFRTEKDYVIAYCEVDLALDGEKNLKEPFVILLEYMTKVIESRALSPNNIYFDAPNARSNSNIFSDKSSIKSGLPRAATQKHEHDSKSLITKNNCCTII